MGILEDFFNGGKGYVDFRMFLTAAANGDNAAVSKHLINNRSDLDRQEAMTGMNALMCATVKGITSTAKLLLDKGASIEGQDQSGFNVLHIAVLCAPKELTELLLQRPDVSTIINEPNPINGVTALMYTTAVAEDPALVKRLLECGADPTLKDDLGRTALDLAKAKGYITTVAVLEQWKRKSTVRPKPLPPKRFEL